MRGCYRKRLPFLKCRVANCTSFGGGYLCAFNLCVLTQQGVFSSSVFGKRPVSTPNQSGPANSSLKKKKKQRSWELFSLKMETLGRAYVKANLRANHHWEWPLRVRVSHKVPRAGWMLNPALWCTPEESEAEKYCAEDHRQRERLSLHTVTWRIWERVCRWIYEVLEVYH